LLLLPASNRQIISLFLGEIMKIATGRSAVLKLSIIVFFVVLLGLIALIGGRGKANASAFGPAAAHTGAPGENNCTACHTGSPVNSGGGNVTITGVPQSYRPGQQVQVTVATTHEGAVIYGFQMTAIDSAGREAGTFSLPVQVPPRMQIVDGNVGGNPRKYVEHTVDGLFPNSWTFTWTAPAHSVGEVGFYAAGNGANSDGGPSGDNIYTTSRESLAKVPLADFDGDAKTDLSIYRPSVGEWFYQKSSDGVVPGFQFGVSTDKIVPGDYTGDGKTDIAIWRPSNGFWFILRSEDFLVYGFPFGTDGDVPVPGDYDGDGKTDAAVFRPTTVTWIINKSSGGVTFHTFGAIGDKPVVADYDGDGKTDIAIYRPSVGEWYYQRSSDGVVPGFQFGSSTDKPVQGDYTGDGKADIAFWRPSTGFWYVLRSEDFLFYGFPWGLATDLPAPGDFDGDGKMDASVFRPSDTVWYINRSTAGVFIQQFGAAADKPVPGAFVP
jgi:hypothetical protein